MSAKEVLHLKAARAPTVFFRLYALLSTISCILNSPAILCLDLYIAVVYLPLFVFVCPYVCLLSLSLSVPPCVCVSVVSLGPVCLWPLWRR